ncbi:MAG: metal ABC transporter permease, partial [Planctomycetota bacterium]
MRTIDYLSQGQFDAALLAAVAIAVVCGVLSPIVVLKRLAFVGQGISHAAFGGVGLAAMLGLGAASMSAPAGLGIILGFCVCAGVGIALLGERGAGLRLDTAIGIFLVASMALGALLLDVAVRGGRVQGAVPEVESVLFGSIVAVGIWDARLAWLVCFGAIAVLWWSRRRVLFWAFDERSAVAFGVDARRTAVFMMIVLGVVIVVGMRLAGVVLATALLVLPGATALRLTSRLGPAFALSVIAALLGVLAGMVLTFETNWPPGPCIVVVQLVLLIVAA